MAEHAAEQGWIYIFPDFQGPNKRPEACGSELAQQNILEAVEWAKGKSKRTVSQCSLLYQDQASMRSSGRVAGDSLLRALSVLLDDLLRDHLRHSLFRNRATRPNQFNWNAELRAGRPDYREDIEERQP